MSGNCWYHRMPGENCTHTFAILVSEFIMIALALVVSCVSSCNHFISFTAKLLILSLLPIVSITSTCQAGMAIFNLRVEWCHNIVLLAGLSWGSWLSHTIIAMVANRVRNFKMKSKQTLVQTWTQMDITAIMVHDINTFGLWPQYWHLENKLLQYCCSFRHL